MAGSSVLDIHTFRQVCMQIDFFNKDNAQLLSCARVNYKVIQVCRSWAGDRDKNATPLCLCFSQYHNFYFLCVSCYKSGTTPFKKLLQLS